MIDAHLVEHRAFLEKCYEKKYLIFSGPQRPRTGGVIISTLDDPAQLENIMKEDPFLIHDLAEYTYIPFDPVKCDPRFACFINAD